MREALLVLADGTTFEGEAIGADAAARPAARWCSTPSSSGYQEVITDPSYAGQIITFTYPHIGNYGVNLADFEARRPFCRGVVVRDLARRRSSWRSEADLDAQLRAYGIPGIAGIDTRKLTRRIRDVGAIPGAFGPARPASTRPRCSPRRKAEPGTDGVDLVAQVTTAEPYRLADGTAPAGGRLRLRHQAHDPAPPRVVVRRRGRARRRPPRPTCWRGDPAGVFLSNGPGRPGGGALRERRHRRPPRQRAGVRHLPRATSSSAGPSAAPP